MNAIQNFSRLVLVMLAILATAGVASADPVVKLSGTGAIALSPEGPSDFVLQGNASHLGKYNCYGEVDFSLATETRGLIGQGVAVIQAANGDLLVGVVTWQIDANGNGQTAFSWRDSVEFSDGTVVLTTGRFVKSRPAGAVSRIKGITDGTSNIIAILIG